MSLYKPTTREHLASDRSSDRKTKGDTKRDGRTGKSSAAWAGTKIKGVREIGADV